MSLYYTGLDAVPGNQTLTDLFNKTSINADNLYSRTNFYGAMIQSTFDDSGRKFLYNTNALILNDDVIYDTDGFFNPDLPGRLTVPQNFDYAEAWCFLRWAPGNWILSLYQNGSIINRFTAGTNSSRNKYCYGTISSGRLAVNDNLYFESTLMSNGAANGQDSFDQTFLSAYSGSIFTEVASPQYSYLMVRAYKS
jgi:hypothetical protein